MAQERSGKEALVAKVAEKFEVSKTKAAEYVTALFEVLAEGIADEGKVALQGFGSFSVSERPARTANVFGEAKQLPAKKAVRFSAGKTLKDRLA